MFKSVIGNIGSLLGSAWPLPGLPAPSTTQTATSQHTAEQQRNAIADQEMGVLAQIQQTATLAATPRASRQWPPIGTANKYIFEITFDPKSGEFVAHASSSPGFAFTRDSLKALIEELPVYVKQRFNVSEEVEIHVNFSRMVIKA